MFYQETVIMKKKNQLLFITEVIISLDSTQTTVLWLQLDKLKTRNCIIYKNAYSLPAYLIIIILVHVDQAYLRPKYCKRWICRVKKPQQREMRNETALWYFVILTDFTIIQFENLVILVKDIIWWYKIHPCQKKMLSRITKIPTFYLQQ